MDSGQCVIMCSLTGDNRVNQMNPNNSAHGSSDCIPVTSRWPYHGKIVDSHVGSWTSIFSGETVVEEECHLSGGTI